MTTRKILQYPSQQLTEISNPVTDFDDSLRSLITDLCDTLEVEGGAGLASPQIGVGKRVLVIKPELFGCDNPDPDSVLGKETWVLVNPEVSFGDDTSTTRWQEVCMSVPWNSGFVSRREKCNVKYQRRDGTVNTLSLDMPLAGVMQHEVDHLNGVLYIDHVGTLDRVRILKRLKKIVHHRLGLFEAKKEQDILDVSGPAALRKYRAERDNTKIVVKKRRKVPKTFGAQKKRK